MRWWRRELAVLPAVLLAVAGCHTAPAARPSPSASSPLATSPASSPAPERTYVYGALGDYGTPGPALRAVVAEMRTFGPLDAVVTTGDNAYCCGTAGQVAFAKAALAPLRAPVYPAIGNHDAVTDGGRPLLRTFGLPGRWYRRVVGPVEWVFLDANRPGDRAQLAWLDAVLAQPRAAAFRVVVFHEPGWSCSFHHADPNVVRLWLPRLRGRVDLVLAGHNHTYERFAGLGGTPYVTTGGGGATLYPSTSAMCGGTGTPKVLKTVHHALRISATSRLLTVAAYDTSGHVIDRFVVPRPQL